MEAPPTEDAVRLHAKGISNTAVRTHRLDDALWQTETLGPKPIVTPSITYPNVAPPDSLPSLTHQSRFGSKLSFRSRR